MFCFALEVIRIAPERFADVLDEAYSNVHTAFDSNSSASDGKHPDGLTLILWRATRSLKRDVDVTVSCTTVDSYLKA